MREKRDPNLLRPLFLALSITLPGAATGSSRLFPLEATHALAAPWLAGQGDEALFSAAFQARKSAEFRANHLGPWEPGSIARRVTTEGAGADTQVLGKLGLAIAEQSGFGPNLRPHGHPDPDAPDLRSLADRPQFVVTQLDEDP